MKFLQLCFVSLLVSCGNTPLDQDYWGDLNEEAKPDTNNNNEREFSISFEALRNYDLEFRNQTFKRNEDGKFTISVDIDYPDSMTLDSYQLSTTACEDQPDEPHVITGELMSRSFSTTSTIQQLNGNPNTNIENHYLYIQARRQGVQIPNYIACSAINL